MSNKLYSFVNTDLLEIPFTDGYKISINGDVVSSEGDILPKIKKKKWMDG